VVSYISFLVVSRKFKEECFKETKLGSQKVIKEIDVDIISSIYTLIVQNKNRYK